MGYDAAAKPALCSFINWWLMRIDMVLISGIQAFCYRLDMNTTNALSMTFSWDDMMISYDRGFTRNVPSIDRE